ncbi:MAG: hypothetical protein U0Y82_04460 [Thermoleophilia bacterium]
MSDVPGASGHRALGGLHLVLVGLALWNIGNYAYFTIAERVSGPRDYATVGALLAVAMLVQIPAGAVQVGVARLIPTFPDRSPEAAWLMRHAVARCVAGGAVAAVVVGVVARLAAPGLSWAEVVWTAVAVLPIPVFSLGTGILQGQQRFGAFAGAVSLLGVPRPLALLALLPAFAAVTSAVAGSAAAMLVAGGAAVALAWPRGVPSPLDPPRHLWRRFLRTLGPLALGLTGVGTLLNLDYIVARATLPAHTAGLFAGVAVLAKATVIIPQAVAWVLQPRVATLEHEGHSASRLLGLGVSITIVTVAVTAGLDRPRRPAPGGAAVRPQIRGRRRVPGAGDRHHRAHRPAAADDEPPAGPRRGRLRLGGRRAGRGGGRAVRGVPPLRGPAAGGGDRGGVCGARGLRAALRTVGRGTLA